MNGSENHSAMEQVTNNVGGPSQRIIQQTIAHDFCESEVDIE